MIARLEAVSGRHVSRETLALLERFVVLLQAGSERQNLIGPITPDQLWERHVVDGAQLVGTAQRSGQWCDIGSGAGLPGVVVAILTLEPMTLIEPRRLRAEFLKHVAGELALEQVQVKASTAQKVRGRFDLITARAVASLTQLLALSAHLSHSGTRWVLPKGERAKSELDEALRSWQGSFKLVPSQTHPKASIIVADGVKPRGKS